MKISEVFTAGGLPSITYNPRDKLQLEHNLLMDLDIEGKIISITGPTKIGKTTLCKKVIPHDKLILVSGGAIQSIEDFWSSIISNLEVPNSWSEDKGNEREKKETSGIKIMGEGGIFGWLKIRAEGTDSESMSKKITTKKAETFAPSQMIIAIQTLLEREKVLIIDDFHFLDTELQTGIIRSIKEPIGSGLKVILCSVPHRGTDTFKVEREMEGRVIQFRIGPWEREELYQISKQGFEALNIECPDCVIQNFISESYKSPHLMQDFCYWFCRDNGIQKKQVFKQSIDKIDFDTFYLKLVDHHSSKDLYDKLVSGPPQPRKQRNFKNGSSGDIYYAIMIALSYLTHITEISVDTVREKLKEILEPSSMPNRNQINSTLQKMAQLAKSHTIREPALDFQNEHVYIVDPFFSFYLKWCEK